MSKEDIEEYLVSGRLEPNLHIFANELHPTHESALEQALQASWLAFLAAKESTDPKVFCGLSTHIPLSRQPDDGSCSVPAFAHSVP